MANEIKKWQVQNRVKPYSPFWVQWGWEFSVIWHRCGQGYHKMHKKSWTWDEHICNSVYIHTYLQSYHSNIFPCNIKPSATLFVPQRYLDLTLYLGSKFSLKSRSLDRLVSKSVCCPAVIPAQLIWPECCSSKQWSAEPVSVLSEMKTCKQKTWPTRWLVFRWRRARLPVLASCPKGSRFQWSSGAWDLPRIVWTCPSCKFQSHWESAEGAEKDLINSLLEPCSSSN